MHLGGEGEPNEGIASEPMCLPHHPQSVTRQLQGVEGKVDLRNARL